MLDYVSISAYMHKDTPFFGNCQQYATYSNGVERYYLNGCDKIKVIWHPSNKLLQIQGSIPYFLQGHNFAFSRKDFKEAIDVLQSLLGVGLWSAEVSEFEFGSIMEVDFKPKEFILNHHAKKGTGLIENQKGKDKGAFKWWESKPLCLKMYDAKKNIKQKQGLARRELISSAGYDESAEYIKFEMICKQPHLLNSNLSLRVEDLVNPTMYEVFKTTLIQNYQMLQSTKTIKSPSSKKGLSTMSIILQAYTAKCINDNMSIEDARKSLYKCINAIDMDVLSKADKDHRKRQIKALFEGLEQSEQSAWDLSDKLAEALENDKL